MTHFLPVLYTCMRRLTRPPSLFPFFSLSYPPSSSALDVPRRKVYAASSLPHTPLSRYIESRVKQRLAKLENDAAADTLTIRLISNVEVKAQTQTKIEAELSVLLIAMCAVHLMRLIWMVVVAERRCPKDCRCGCFLFANSFWVYAIVVCLVTRG